MSTSKKTEVAVTAPVKEETSVVSAVTIKLRDSIHEDLKEVSKRFVHIGYSLYNFKEDRLYKELGYKTFDAFVKAEFNLSKGTAYNFINVAAKFTIPSPEGTPTLNMKKEFRQFSSSQLVEMIGLDDDTLASVKPTDTIRELKKLKKNVQTSEQNDSDDTDKKSKPKVKPSEKDTKIPVNRLFIGTAYSFEEIAIHKAIIDKMCDDKKRKSDGKNYRVEVNIIWDDLTSSDDAEKVEQAMNEPIMDDPGEE